MPSVRAWRGQFSVESSSERDGHADSEGSMQTRCSKRSTHYRAWRHAHRVASVIQVEISAPRLIKLRAGYSL